MARGRPKDSTRKSDGCALEALWLIDRGMERRAGKGRSPSAAAPRRPHPPPGARVVDGRPSSTASTTGARGSGALDGERDAPSSGYKMTVEHQYAAAEAEGPQMLLRDDGNKTGFMNVSKDRAPGRRRAERQIDGRHIGVPTAEEAAPRRRLTARCAVAAAGRAGAERRRRRRAGAQAARIAAKPRPSMEGRFPASARRRRWRSRGGGWWECSTKPTPRRARWWDGVERERGGGRRLAISASCCARPAAAASVVTEAEIVSPHLHAAGELPIKS